MTIGNCGNQNTSLFKPGELVRPKRVWDADSLFDKSTSVSIQRGCNLIFICVRTIRDSVQIEFIWLDELGRLLSDKWLKGTATDTIWRKNNFY